jgi:hypothetical protein
MFFGLL